MPKVRLCSIYNTPEGTWHPGSVVDVSPEVATKLVDGRGGWIVDTKTEASPRSGPPPLDEDRIDVSPVDITSKRAKAK